MPLKVAAYLKGVGITKVTLDEQNNLVFTLSNGKVENVGALNVDTSLNSESKNPVQNKALYAALRELEGYVNAKDNEGVLRDQNNKAELQEAIGRVNSALASHKAEYDNFFALANAQLARVESGSVVTDNTSQKVIRGDNKPVSGGAIYTALQGKVDKVEGKGLSTNDYTDEEKAQVAKIAELSNEKKVDLVLPDIIDAVVGDNMQLFFRSIVSAVNPYNYDIYAVSAVGKSYPRYYELKPTEEMLGNQYPMTIYVKDDNGKILAQKSSIIVVHDAMSAPTSAINVLCVGASATATGIWCGELKRRLTSADGNGTPANPTGLGLANINFVGRKVGTQVDVNLEATGGWRVRDYASKGQRAIRFYVNGVDTIALGARYSCNGTIYAVQEVNVTQGGGNIRCTLENAFVVPSDKLSKVSGSGDAEITFSSYAEENFSAFWDNAESKINFKQYAQNYCDGKIDCLVWHCGVNDITSGDVSIIPNVISAFRKLLNAYHADFPSGKVIISSVPIGSVNGGFAANYGANASLNYFSFTKIAQAYATALCALCGESDYADYVTYAPALETFDAENAYPVVQTPVNNRSTSKESVGTNALHPIAEGSYQIADTVYRAFNALRMEVEVGEISPIDVKDGVYIGLNGVISNTASPRSIASFPIQMRGKYKIDVPQTGNMYTAVYAFSDKGQVAAGDICKEWVGTGDEKPTTMTFTAPSYKYVHVCYTTTGGVPTLTRL